MTESKSSRKESIKNLTRLSARGDIMSMSLPELFPFGIFSDEPRIPAYDRDIVITSCALLEQGLEEGILKYINLRPDAEDLLISGHSSILRDFGDKIQMAYLVGVIGPETRKDLGCIRAIRNTFAHNRGYLDFDVPEIAAVLSHINVAERYAEIMERTPQSDLRERFIQMSFNLAMYLFAGSGPDRTELGQVMDSRRTAFQQ